MPKEGNYLEPNDSFDGLELEEDINYSLVVPSDDEYKERNKRTLLPPETTMTAEEHNNIPIVIEDERSKTLKQPSMFGMGGLGVSFGIKQLTPEQAKALIKKYINVPIEQVPGTGWRGDRQLLARARQNPTLVAEAKAELDREAAIKWAEANVGTIKAAEEARASAVKAAEASKTAAEASQVVATQAQEAAKATSAVATEAYIQQQAAQAVQQTQVAPQQATAMPAYSMPTLPVEEVVQPADGQTAYNIALQSLNKMGLPLTDKNMNLALNMTAEEMAKAKTEEITGTKPKTTTKPFPWIWVGGGILTGLVGLIILTRPKRSAA